MPSGSVNFPAGAFPVGAGGAARARMENRNEGVVKGLLKGDYKPEVDEAFEGFNTGFAGVLQRMLTGSGSGPLSSGLSFVRDLLSLRWAQVDTHDVDIEITRRIAMSAQSQLQDIANNIEDPTGQFNGMQWSTVFGGVVGSPLATADWGGPGSLVVRTEAGYVGPASGLPDGVHHAFTTRTFNTDWQSVSVVVGTSVSRGGSLSSAMFCRCNEDMTSGVYCRFTDSLIDVGVFTRTGTTLTPTSIISRAITVKQGDIIRLRVNGHTYNVLVNGVSVFSFTDPNSRAAIGLQYRTAGVSCLRHSDFFGPTDSYRLASFAMADWLPPGADVSTPSWRIRRGATGAAALTVAHGATAPMPDNFFTVNDLSEQVGVNMTTGAVTIQETGWYEITATSTNVDTSDASSSLGTQDNLANAYRPSPWVIYVDGTPIAGPIMAGTASTVYLVAGQVVRTGVSASWPFTTTLVSEGGTSGFHSYSRSNITHVSGGPAASFTGRKV
ncbi:minor tail protein [Gordonia phage Octobien14]|uniref:Minor tail protein n=1 Tax=Gordonia phage Octobien14 TaxID=2483673 RepID=A0A3G3MAR6_9CAUD|nr:minor tail protein [Gordonia phage Octobien14]AYR03178.1 minor tail protein [Gordonia phage Octobien14]